MRLFLFFRMTKAIDAVDNGLSYRAAADRFQVKRSSLMSHRKQPDMKYVSGRQQHSTWRVLARRIDRRQRQQHST